MDKLDYKELAELISKVQDKVEKDLMTANRFGELSKVLKQYNYIEETEKIESAYYSNNAKILILGEITAKINDIEYTFKNLGIPRDKFEIITDYEKLTNFFSSFSSTLFISIKSILSLNLIISSLYAYTFSANKTYFFLDS